MPYESSGWTLATGDLLITEQPALLHGVVVNASSAGGYITLYDGTDETSGRKIGDFKGAENVSRDVGFNPPLLCLNGIYTVAASHVDGALICWSPRPEQGF